MFLGCDLHKCFFPRGWDKKTKGWPPWARWDKAVCFPAALGLESTAGLFQNVPFPSPHRRHEVIFLLAFHGENMVGFLVVKPRELWAPLPPGLQPLRVSLMLVYTQSPAFRPNYHQEFSLVCSSNDLGSRWAPHGRFCVSTSVQISGWHLWPHFSDGSRTSR